MILLLLSVGQVSFGDSNLVEIGGTVRQALSDGFSGPRYARHDPSPLVNCVVAEDGSSVWIASGSHFLRNQNFKWHQIALPMGTMKESELFRFHYFPADKKVVAYSLSQSALVEPAFRAQKKDFSAENSTEWRLTRDSSGLAAALDDQRVISVADETARESKTMVAVGLIDIAKRGTDPNRAAGTGVAVQNRDPRIGSIIGKTRIEFVEASERGANVYAYDFKANKLARSALQLPIVYKGKPVSPRLYDFREKRTFYDFALPGDEKGRMWTEYVGNRKRWLRYTMPPGEPGPVYLGRGTVWSNTWDSSGHLQLYRASKDRKTWDHVGPYVLVGRSFSDRYCILYDGAKQKVFEAVFPNLP